MYKRNLIQVQKRPKTGTKGRGTERQRETDRERDREKQPERKDGNDK
jgi:hypothetical protein